MANEENVPWAGAAQPGSFRNCRSGRRLESPSAQTRGRGAAAAAAAAAPGPSRSRAPRRRPAAGPQRDARQEPAVRGRRSDRHGHEGEGRAAQAPAAPRRRWGRPGRGRGRRCRRRGRRGAARGAGAFGGPAGGAGGSRGGTPDGSGASCKVCAGAWAAARPGGRKVPAAPGSLGGAAPALGGPWWCPEWCPLPVAHVRPPRRERPLPPPGGGPPARRPLLGGPTPGEKTRRFTFRPASERAPGEGKQKLNAPRFPFLHFSCFSLFLLFCYLFSLNGISSVIKIQRGK